ncbi:hypothetical protein [Nocardia sp. NPDC052566]|uniref:hypothetical protein n=1 Tax=Nocardia sp. NPDC052566 TaxID=3364330 RepID=UPI0037CC3AD4
MLPLPGMPDGGGVAGESAQQLVLIGVPQPVRIPAAQWRSWLTDPAVVDRFEQKRYRRPGDRCWPWIAGVSSTGHGTFRAASLPGPHRRGTVPAHLFGYQLEFGVITRLGWSDADDAQVCHQCDFAGCVNPNHMRLGTNSINRREYELRRRNLASPLADVRGAAGRTRAIAEAVHAGLSNNESPELIEMRIAAAEDVGKPLSLW